MEITAAASPVAPRNPQGSPHPARVVKAPGAQELLRQPVPLPCQTLAHLPPPRANPSRSRSARGQPEGSRPAPAQGGGGGRAGRLGLHPPRSRGNLFPRGLAATQPRFRFSGGARSDTSVVKAGRGEHGQRSVLLGVRGAARGVAATGSQRRAEGAPGLRGAAVRHRGTAPARPAPRPGRRPRPRREVGAAGGVSGAGERRPRPPRRVAASGAELPGHRLGVRGAACGGHGNGSAPGSLHSSLRGLREAGLPEAPGGIATRPRPPWGSLR